MSVAADLAPLLEANPPDLVAAAVHLGVLEGLPVDLAGVGDQLEEWGAELRRRLLVLPSDTEALATLTDYLFVELGFRGNVDDYYDPRNSLLQEVLRRRLGIPITLSLLTIEVGRRAGLPLVGIGFPAHFLVRFRGPEDPVYLDPFHGGRLLAPEALPTFLNQVTGGTLTLDASHLEPTSEREFLARMLGNLQAIYRRAEEFPKLLDVLDAQILLHPRSASDHRERGLLHYEMGHRSEARRDLLRYLDLSPLPPDAPRIQAYLDELPRAERVVD